jgi:transcriptional regulator with XRE-family HTH domain
MPRTAVSEIHAKVVGREIKATRSELGLTQAQVAERLGASASYVAAVEAGRHNLTLGQIANIANAMRLGVRVAFVRPDGTDVLHGSSAVRVEERLAVLQRYGHERRETRDRAR